MKIEILKNNYCLLLSEFEFYYNGKSYIIDKGFYFNGGSIPRILWAISHPYLYPYLIAYLIHDYMYSNKFKTPVTRKECDLFFLYNISRHNKFFGLLFYIGVRIGGWKNFKKNLPFNKNDYNKLRII